VSHAPNVANHDELSDRIAEEFLEFRRRARNPDRILEGYVKRFPRHQNELRELADDDDRLALALGDHPVQLGEFRVIRWIAHGGMGDVYLAEQEPLARRVAVKTVRRGRVSAGAQQRFETEQAVLAQLHQTHVVPIHTAGVEGTIQYFAMPFVDGITLRQGLNALCAANASERISTLVDAVRASTLAAPASPNPQLVAAIPEPPAPPSRSANRLRLQVSYFQTVAQILIDMAEALHHAHQARIVHRDVKPSNVMLDLHGQCWIIDFGLAGVIDSPTNPPAVVAGEETDATRSEVGTYQYMAPEQWTGQEIDNRTDVWGLGVTMYELLSLRPAFRGASPDEIRANVLTTAPPAPATLVKGVPRDLVAICRKAMNKLPSERYATAQKFADDLRSWQRNVPVSVRRGIGRRLSLWTRRNKAWTAVIATVLLTVAAIAAQTGIAQENRNREARRQAMLFRLQSVRQSAHSQGWSFDALAVARQAARIRQDDELRNLAAGCLIGLDATYDKKFTEFDAASVQFDATGEHLLMGPGGGWPGRKNVNPPRAAVPASMWSAGTDDRQLLEADGDGPVVWSGSEPMQFVRVKADRYRFEWRNLRRGLVRDFKIPKPEGPDHDASDETSILAVAPDGKTVAAAVSLPDGSTSLVVWNADTGAVIREEHGLTVPITALTIEPRTALLAAGNQDGTITIWPIPEGDSYSLPAPGRGEILSLAIHAGCERADGDDDRRSGWLLASGDNGGNIVIWNLQRRLPVAYDHGATYGVYQLAFRCDGAILAAAGRGPVRLFDVATGRQLLAVFMGDFCTGLTFSPDGTRLAASNRTVYGGEGGVFVCALELGRGIQTLRGFRGQIARVRLSEDGSRVAGMSHDWQIGIWDVKTGMLLHVLNAPRASFTDNADMAFSHDGRRLAFAAGAKARLWSTVDGTEQSTWELPVGLHDALAFTADDRRLMSCRIETLSEQGQPFGRRDPAQDPIVCRVRDLLSDAPQKEIARVEGLKSGIHDIIAAPDAGFFVVSRVKYAGEAEDVAEIYKGFSADRLHVLAADASPRLDPGGKLLLAGRSVRGPVGDVYELPGGKLAGTWDNPAIQCISPGGRMGAGQPAVENIPHTMTLWRRDSREALVNVPNEVGITSTVNAFSADGRLLAWGNADGTVCVCTLRELQQRLSAQGLGWE
jgi:serine/threonine protein kinase/WD40 repeat protein